MRQMIYFGDEQDKFLLRAAAVVLKDGKVLLQRIGDHDFWCLPGGRVEMTESTRDGLEREIFEECRDNGEVGRLIWVIENFYTHKGVREHEVGLYYDVRFPADSHVHQAEWTSVEEDGSPLLFKWYSIDELAAVNLKPQLLRTYLEDIPEVVTHYVHRE